MWSFEAVQVNLIAKRPQAREYLKILIVTDI